MPLYDHNPAIGFYHALALRQHGRPQRGRHFVDHEYYRDEVKRLAGEVEAGGILKAQFSGIAQFAPWPA